MTAKEVINALKLEPHPTEGGYFIETYRSKETMTNELHGTRSVSTAIYYLLTGEENSFSEMHILGIDEMFHFYIGDPIEMLHLYADGTGQTVTFGSDVLAGMYPQVLVPANVWQGARLKSGGKFALMGTTVAPGFEYKDYKSGSRKELAEKFPKYKDLIAQLTRKP